MQTFKGNVFANQRVLLDGNAFVGNRFDNCVLVYGGGPLQFSNNVLNNVQWEFVGNAARTVGLLSSFYQADGESKAFVESLLAGFTTAPTALPQNALLAPETVQT